MTKIAANIEDNLDAVLLTFRKRLRSDDPLKIVTYRTYGTVNRLYVKGRVLEDKGIRKSSEADSIWTNILSMYKRFESDEVPHAKLQINFQGKSYSVTTDKEGYFTIDLFTEQPLPWEDMWHELDVKLLEAPLSFVPDLKATAEILVPPPDAEYGIISDIDDTVVKTSATNLLAMSRNTFLHNAHTRLPFAGVSEFFCSLFPSLTFF